MSDIESFNTPDIEEVLQEDEPEVLSVPVIVKNIVRTDEMPTRTVYRNKKLITAGVPEKLLNADPRRKSFVIWFTYVGSAPANNTPFVCIGSRSGDVQNFVGAQLFSLTAVTRYEFTDRDEVWVRPGSIVNSTTSITLPYVASTNDISLNLAIEQWTN